MYNALITYAFYQRSKEGDKWHIAKVILVNYLLLDV